MNVSPLSVADAAIAGMAGLLASYEARLYALRRHRSEHLWLAILCVVTGGYATSMAIHYDAGAETALVLSRLEGVLLGTAAHAALAWALAVSARFTPRRRAALLTSWSVSTVLLLSPWVVTDVQPFTAIAGDNPVYRRTQNTLVDLFSGYGVLMAILATVVVSRAPKSRRRETRYFFIGLTVWCGVAAHTFAMAALGHWPAFSTVEYGFLALAMSLVAHDVGKYLQMLETSEAETADARLQQRAQARLYRDVVAAVADGVVLVDNEDKVRLWNRGMAELTGIPETRALNRSLWELLPTARGARDELFETDSRVELHLGSDTLVELGAAEVEIDDQPGFVLVAHDVTQKKELTGRLMEADRLAAVGTLAAGISHEINNPLSYVILNLEELERDAAAGPGRELLDGALLGARRIRDIVRAVGVFSRSEEERTRLRLSEVADSAVAMVQSEIRQRAKVQVEHRDHATALGNETKLAQVVLNLLVNALHAIPEGDPSHNVIELRTFVDGARAVCEVRDSGVGIAPEIRDRVFDPFFTTKPVGAGTGLGLTICRETVRALGGDIEIDGGAVGGTTFRVVLPATEPESEPASRPRPRRSMPDRRYRVLVVDDEPAVLRALARELRRHYQVTACSSATEALERLDDGEPFDAIVTDVMMPGTTGIELYEKIERRSPQVAQRVVFTTGGAFTAETREFCERMHERVCDKPVDVERLREQIALAASRGSDRPSLSAGA